jgi:hypothetical protein
MAPSPDALGVLPSKSRLSPEPACVRPKRIIRGARLSI